MSLEILVACSETAFRFDTDELRRSAANRWSGTTYVEADPTWAHLAEGEIHVLGDDGVTESEINLHNGGGAVGLDSRTIETAADVLAWLAATPGLPEDGSVVVHPLAERGLPATARYHAEELAADYQL